MEAYALKKKSIAVMATFLVLALGSNLAMAAYNPSGPRDSQFAPVAAPAQEIQPPPAMGIRPRNYTSAPVGLQYRGATSYPCWGYSQNHQARWHSYSGWSCGWGCW